MKSFKKILVGVDLSWGDRFVSDELSPPNAEAVHQSLWLAKLNSSSIEFMFALDLSTRAKQLMSESDANEASLLRQADDSLADLVQQARQAGVQADSHVVVGKSWMELIRHSIRQEKDLVVVGSRNLGAIESALLGSTGIKLLRNCPCAVWVTRPPEDKQFDSILVAHDLRPVGDLAMDIGCSMAGLQDAQLHVVHAAEYPELDYMFPAKVSAERKQDYHREAEQHIQRQLANMQLSQTAKMHIIAAPPDVAIMKFIEQHNIDLVVMGTVGRTGISGFITGNTAERLLPRISCSVLAIKPEGFKSPVE